MVYKMSIEETDHGRTSFFEPQKDSTPGSIIILFNAKSNKGSLARLIKLSCSEDLVRGTTCAV